MAPKHLGFASKVLGSTAWTTAVKSGRQLVTPINRLTRLLTGAFSSGFVRVNLTFCFHCASIYKSQGIPGVVKRLKVAQVLTMQAVAGSKHNSTQAVGVAVARSKNGLPRIIPSLHRKAIMNGDTVLIRYWLTLFGLYRVLEMPGKAKFSTIFEESAMKPWILEEIKKFAPTFIDRAPFQWKEWRTWRIKPLLLTTSGPNGLRQGTAIASSLVAAYQLWREGAGEGTMYSMFHAFFASWSHDYMDRNQAQTYNSLWLDKFRMLGGTYGAERMASASFLPDDIEEDSEYRLFGRLVMKPEPAGKVRVFAMLDYFTQMVLHPLHRHIFSLLKRIPQDGTFDQHKPIARLAERARRGALPYVRSIDLSAATDRFPIKAQVALLSELFNPAFGDLWARILVDRDYLLIPTSREEARGIEIARFRYGAGQPMGAYSSWAVFSLTHHLLVQLAAERVGIRSWFRDYALLGDDLVIAHKRVAQEYLNLAQALGVNISAAKSLNSRNGSFEFAKRFIFKGIDVSPLSFKEFDVAIRHLPSLLGLVKRVGNSKIRLSQVMGALGFGYRVLGSLNKKLSKLGSRTRGAIVALRSPHSVLDIGGWDAWLQMVTAYAVKPFRSDISDRVSQSLGDRYSELVLKVLHGIVPEALKLWYVEPLKDFIKARDWMIALPIPEYPVPNWTRPHVPFLELPELDRWANLVLRPLVRQVAERTREVILRIADPNKQHELEARLGSYDWLRSIKRLELSSQAWSDAIVSLLKHSKELALFGMLRKLEVFDRPVMEAKIPKDAGKLKRLHSAMNKVAGRQLIKWIPNKDNQKKIPKTLPNWKLGGSKGARKLSPVR